MILPIVMRLNLFRFSVFSVAVYTNISIYITTAVEHEQSNWMGNNFSLEFFFFFGSLNLIFPFFCVLSSLSHSLVFWQQFFFRKKHTNSLQRCCYFYIVCLTWMENKNSIGKASPCYQFNFARFSKIVSFLHFVRSISLFIALEPVSVLRFIFLIFLYFLYHFLCVETGVEFLLLWCFFLPLWTVAAWTSAEKSQP